MSDFTSSSTPNTFQVPPELTRTEDCPPAYFVDTSALDLDDPASVEKTNEVLFETFCQLHDDVIKGQALLKVHVGEPKCTTRLNPEFMSSSSRFLEYRGAGSVVAGDTTVAYSGQRGHRQNPVGNASVYLNLAARHGWARGGKAGLPFVILDRPGTAVPGIFEFSEPFHTFRIDGIQRFSDFFPAGGFVASDFMINHAHLTLHGLAGFAGCIKNIAMGCSALEGKLRMHKSLLPFFDASECMKCGRCADHCPEKAIILHDNDIPEVIQEQCIGCGECVSVCSKKAVTLQGKEISDWKLGEETLPERMTDYAVGIMNGKWDRTIHILHMYRITELCDCVNQKQVPLVKDIGFVMGNNPFAVDRIGADILFNVLSPEQQSRHDRQISVAHKTAAYAEQHYGIVSNVPLQPLQLKP